MKTDYLTNVQEKCMNNLKSECWVYFALCSLRNSSTACYIELYFISHNKCLKLALSKTKLSSFDTEYLFRECEIDRGRDMIHNYESWLCIHKRISNSIFLHVSREVTDGMCFVQ